MSELTNVSSARKDFRWKLLTTVSALALLGVICAADETKAADGDHPTVWIEVGGQLEQMSAGEQQFTPPFILATPRPMPETVSPLSVAHPPHFSIGGNAKITFEPEGSNWVFSAAIRYGRSNGYQHLRQQSPYPTKPIQGVKYQRVLQFIDTAARHDENHGILDFQAGKDVGVGLFGGGGSSVFNLGVRLAQFRERSNIAFKSDPDAKLKYYRGYKTGEGATYHFNAASGTASRSFQGIGPSLSWSNSTPMGGDPQGGEFALDWGVNAAVLFGRQKAIVHHQTTAQYHKGKYGTGSSYNFRTTLYRHTPPDRHRSRTVTVPNVGGFAGLSFRYSNAKLSLGYRADFFFGAMDDGIDAAKRENRGFYGPFASVSVGIGG